METVWSPDPGAPRDPSASAIAEIWERMIVPEFLKDIHSSRDLTNQVQALRSEVALLRKALEESPFHVRVIETHEVTLEQAQAEVETYLEEHGKGYPSDIADELGISLEDAVEALNALQKKGTVRPRA